MQPRIRLAFWAASGTLPAHLELLTHQYPQVLLLRAALELLSTQPVLVFGIALTHVQDLALSLVELHAVHAGSHLQSVKVPLNGIPSLQCANHTTELGVGKLAEGALSPTVHVANKDIKQHWPQYQPVRYTTHLLTCSFFTDPLHRLVNFYLYGIHADNHTPR